MSRPKEIAEIFIIEYSPKDREQWTSTTYDPFFDENEVKQEIEYLNGPIRDSRNFRYRYVKFVRKEI